MRPRPPCICFISFTSHIHESVPHPSTEGKGSSLCNSFCTTILSMLELLYTSVTSRIISRILDQLYIFIARMIGCLLLPIIRVGSLLEYTSSKRWCGIRLVEWSKSNLLRTDRSWSRIRQGAVIILLTWFPWIMYRVFMKYCIFFEDFKIFRTLAFLCFPSVSVWVYTTGRWNTSAASELAEFRKNIKF